MVEVQGAYREIGRGLGSAMKGPIKECFSNSPDFPNCLDYLEGSGKARLEKMLEHVRALFPHLVDELEGMAEALEMRFMELFAYNCRSEISVLSKTPGCSTLAYKGGKKMILAHNEDGGDTNVGGMYIARVKPPSGVSYISFVYPGLFPGNGPGVNEHGVVQTTNYIQPKSVADGVPRYFLGRAVLEAKELDEAVTIATTEPRAFSWHHNLASLNEERLVSLETMPGKYDLMEVEGGYLHTNHLIHPAFSRENSPDGEPYDVPYVSSLTRMRVLNDAIEADKAPSTAKKMVELLSLHEGKPYSPCRHPQGDVHGITLGTAVFEAPALEMKLFHGNPCNRFEKVHTI